MKLADQILAAAPCSIEMPAGTGKTKTIGDLVAAVAERGRKSLVLTHTHAGVDALRRRLAIRGMTSQHVSVRTLDSWCFDLIRSYPILSELEVPSSPDWKDSGEYHHAGATATRARAIRRMLLVSYGVVVVDEYQDCQLHQHELVLALSESLPTIVLGDRMQGLFWFSGQTSVRWDHEVEAAFPRFEAPIFPWRWFKKNDKLGDWLLSVRRDMLDGKTVTFDDGPLTRYPASTGLATACKSQPRHPATTVAVCRLPNDAKSVAQTLGGDYTMLEEVEGRHLRTFAANFDSGSTATRASVALEFAVSCYSGLASHFPSEKRKRLIQGKAIRAVKSPQLEACQAFSNLLDDASPASVLVAFGSLALLDGIKLYRREAWHGVREALRMCALDDQLSVSEAVDHQRNRLSVIGRRPESRVVGRTLLVKGLEFDHAVVVKPESMNAHELYVALSRGSYSLTVVSDHSTATPSRPC